MSDTTFFGQRELTRTVFLSLEHGTEFITLTVKGQDGFEEARLMPADARAMAADLFRRADAIDKVRA